MDVLALTTRDGLVAAYEDHQPRVRGLRAATLHSYARFIREFIDAALGEEPIDIRSLTPPDVVAFALSTTERFSPQSMKLVRAALRSFLGYLLAMGLGDARLVAAVPRTASWRHARLPRGLSDEQLAAVLSAPLPSAPCAWRDRAIVVSLASLGLRPGELAALRLGDIDWRRSLLTLATRKTRRGAVLPLSASAALARGAGRRRWLHAPSARRSRCTDRRRAQVPLGNARWICSDIGRMARDLHARASATLAASGSADAHRPKRRSFTQSRAWRARSPTVRRGA